MTRPNCAAVLFDLDGTLIDSAPDLMAAMNCLLAREGRAAVDAVAFRAAVSKGGHAMVAVAFADLDGAAQAQRLSGFIERYAAHIAEHSRAFAGITEVLAALEAACVPWAVVSNKAEAMVRALLAAMPWAAACATVVGGDTLPVKKPDPAPLRLACAALGVAPDACVYVGDDERDVLAARACGMKAVAALWGYRGADERPQAWGADALVATPTDLLAVGILDRKIADAG
ncbi:MAG: phosphoglycolate phosphatase [Lysobacterales bacterium CG17_big_fil_post_rev_8_21_14_2_50_64_11]|nr:MAG: phosphoglycolate phosphatase [Xanthomonadales bacterium CG17_big_fil_post_rev_8_21_14_2_50_64_11]PIX59506.1 MAG: phosphoglycolate phosphatase [Xanthomonadales bacterium CG_4_10_14_3_um_filter_64_11]